MIDSKKDKPLVSIVIPVYNGSNYLQQAIESALNQTYENIEIIVVNDGSTDGGKTAEIAKSYGERIMYIEKSNGGSSSALNEGIRRMNGQWFSWLSHDDLYKPQKIEKEIEAIMASNEEKCVAIANTCIIDEHSKLKDEIRKIRTSKVYKWSEAFEHLYLKYAIDGCSVLIPKKAFQEIGFFREDIIYINDMDYWQRLVFNGYSFVALEDILTCTRMHSEQVTNKHPELFVKESKVLNKVIADKTLSLGNNYKNLIHPLAKSCLRYNDRDTVKYISGKLNGQDKIWYWIRVCPYQVWGIAFTILRKAYKRIGKR